MRKHHRLEKTFAALLTIALLVPSLARAQTSFRLKIEMVNSEAFPKIEAYASISDAQGLPLRNLAKEQFTLAEDGIPVNSFEIMPVQNTQQSLAFALAIDASGSMGQGSAPRPLDNAIVAAKDFVASLSPQDQIGVISFADQVNVALELSTDQNAARAALDGLQAAGNTALYDAVMEAINLVRDADSRRAVILITDGIESGISRTKIDAALAEAIRAGVPIYPIGFGEVNKVELERMAQLTGGYAQVQPGSRALKAAFSTVTQILREQYLISFSSSLPPDGKEHQISVSVRHREEYAQQDYRFVAVPGQLKVIPNQTEGQSLGGLIKLAPTILSPVTVKRLDIAIDGGPLTSLETPPFEYDWDASKIAAGPHQLCFTVTDPADRTDQACVGIVVAPAITIAINSPAEGSAAGNAVSLDATVTALSAVAGVEFLIDERSVQTFAASGPYRYEASTAGLTPGNHTFTVRANDATGRIETASVVFQAYQALGITFTGPSPSEILKGTTTIGLEISSPDPVKQVEILVDGKSFAKLTRGPYQVEWPLYNVANGEHTLQAIAVNETGHEGKNELIVQVGGGGGGGGSGGGGLAGFIIALAIVLGAAAVLIPLALRKRKAQKIPGMGGAQPFGASPGVVMGPGVLVELEGNQPGQEWLVGETDLRLGRQRAENDLPLKGLGASRQHAIIRFQAGVYMLYNLKPQNPTLINNQPVMQQQALQNGDILQMGETVLRFELR